ncbi:hypothetical protein [Sphingomonas sp. PAMC 26605]|uniref:hypothetical protein n=1 Tax=Sphingomonas sp. PAMC 26605 TaxID=1112214 RepID=UPI00026CA79D|nr:hypothetical protein [Sphingomonas sp. PAMC 26605]
MIGRRTLIELLHIAAGLLGAAVIAYGAVWALPHAASPIWEVALGMMAVIVLMGLPPLRLAWRAQRDPALRD